MIKYLRKKYFSTNRDRITQIQKDICALAKRVDDNYFTLKYMDKTLYDTVSEHFKLADKVNTISLKLDVHTVTHDSKLDKQNAT